MLMDILVEISLERNIAGELDLRILELIVVQEGTEDYGSAVE